MNQPSPLVLDVAGKLGHPQRFDYRLCTLTVQRLLCTSHRHIVLSICVHPEAVTLVPRAPAPPTYAFGARPASSTRVQTAMTSTSAPPYSRGPQARLRRLRPPETVSRTHESGRACRSRMLGERGRGHGCLMAEVLDKRQPDPVQRRVFAPSTSTIGIVAVTWATSALSMWTLAAPAEPDILELDFYLLNCVERRPLAILADSKHLRAAVVLPTKYSLQKRPEIPVYPVPVELIGTIAEFLAYWDDGSSASVVQAATNTAAFSQVCMDIRGACLLFGAPWSNINLFLSNWRPRVRPPSIEEFKERMARTRNAPLRICFNVNLHLLLGGGYIGDAVWAELLRLRKRWSVLYLDGPSECLASAVCAKASAFSALLSRPNFGLTIISLLSTDRSYRCTSNHAGEVVIDLSGVCRLTSSIPFTMLHAVDDLPCAGTLMYLDVANQLGTSVIAVFKHAPNLETLNWRSNEAVALGPPVDLPKLLQLFIYSLRVPPPIVAKNVVEMVVQDVHYPLDDATFGALVGGYDTGLKLRYLDIMGNNGITNFNLNAIWDRCRRFVHRFAFPSAPSGQARSEMYRLIGDQVARDYVLNSKCRLRSVKCHGRPTRQPGMRLFDFLWRMGEIGPDSRLELHCNIWRLICGPCAGRFDVRDSDLFEEFKAGNSIPCGLVLIAMYEKYLKPNEPVPQTFTLMLVFSSLDVASGVLERGVVFRGTRCEWVKTLEGYGNW
ncbi:hypothetical protein DFH06DRAFT_1133589 [Mycena polygramma]|nr:hypothetical protein DFH06DRAFT_1133589 [Mycena polygramma]